MYNSLIGMYVIYPELFKQLELPDSIDKETAVNNILLKCGEFEILYAAPHFLADMIGVWSRCKKYQFETLANTTAFEYNPIENYDRLEDFEEKIDNQQSGSSTESGNNSGNSEKSVAGFESNKYVGSEKIANNEDSNSKSTATNTGSSKTTHSLHMHGNIGVMSTQDMIKQEREISRFSVYDAISDEFMREFCIAVY